MAAAQLQSEETVHASFSHPSQARCAHWRVANARGTDDDRGAIAIAKPQQLIVDKGLPGVTVTATLKPVDAFYGFWNNGSRKLHTPNCLTSAPRSYNKSRSRTPLPLCLVLSPWLVL
jgi:hypothetical protein